MYPMGTLTATEHPIVPNDIKPTQITDSYSAPFIDRPSVFSSAHHQHQQYSAVVNPELPMSSPNMSQWSLNPSTSRNFPVQQPGFCSLNVPQNGVPWKCPDWMANQTIQPGTYMSFNGQQQSRLPFKRKAAPDMDMSFQSKQLITDEKMAAHLNGMHISSEYKAHDINQTGQSSDALDIDGESSSALSPYPSTLQDIEEKLKRAQKITVSDVVKDFQGEPLLPAAILERFEKPCKALVIWQPPQRITDLIVSKSFQEQQTSDDESNDNNNVEFLDANNDTDMDLDS